jgi:hypothetical protein
MNDHGIENFDIEGDGDDGGGSFVLGLLAGVCLSSMLWVLITVAWFIR